MDQELPRYLKKRVMRIALYPVKLFPIRNNRILIHNDLAQNYSANPKYIAEELISTYKGKFDIVFSVKNPDKYADCGLPIRFVKYKSWSFFFAALTSKVFISNSGGYSFLPLKKKQYVINTHHGGGAYNTAGLDMFGDTPLFRKDILMSSNPCDIFLSTCRKFTKVISKAMLIPEEKFWEIGMPRNDILINNDDKLRQKVREKIGLKENEHLVLYAPTYRKPEDDYFNESIAISYDINCKEVCEALTKRFGGIWKFAFRLHPCVTNRNELPKGNVIDLSDYEEMQELLMVADVMINDFSSSMWDFMLTSKPCFIYAKDLDHYIETTKLYTPVEEWPFPKSISNEQLIDCITSFDENMYSENCKKHYEALGGCETGKATKLVAKKICEITGIE